MNPKQCARCGLYKPPSAFNRCLEHADRLSHWCLACDKRNAKRGYGNQAVSWPPGVTLPHRDTQCQVCQVEWRFDTDREGCVVQICQCKTAYVEIRVAPKRERKPCGKRNDKGIDNLARPISLVDASGQRETAKGHGSRGAWAFDIRDLPSGR